MMHRLTFCVVALLASLVVSELQAGLVAYWNFNSFDPATDTTIIADQGDGTISLTGWDGGLNDYKGHTDNALGSDPAGGSLSLVDQAGNGSFIELSFSMAGRRELEISYWTRRTGTGFDANQWSYSLDGVNYTDVGPTIDPSTSSAGRLEGPLLLTELDNAESAFLRYTLDGATSATGNNRIDNLQLTASATAVPEPSSLAALGMAGLSWMLLRRGRRRR